MEKSTYDNPTAIECTFCGRIERMAKWGVSQAMLNPKQFGPCPNRIVYSGGKQMQGDHVFKVHIIR